LHWHVARYRRKRDRSGDEHGLLDSVGSGATYYIALKYSTSSVIGETAPSPKPKVEYTFATVGVAGSQRELDVVG